MNVKARVLSQPFLHFGVFMGRVVVADQVQRFIRKRP